MAPAAKKERATGPRSRGPLARVLAVAGRAADYRHTGLAVALTYLAVLAYVGLRYHIIGDGESETDFFGAYVVQARAFLDGRVAIDPYRGPAYPIALALFGSLVKPLGAGLFEAGILVSAISAALVLYLHHGLARRLFGAGVALAATLLLALNPTFVRYSYTTGTDMFFVFLSLAAVALTIGGKGWSWGRMAGLGAVLSLAYLTRYNGGVFLAAAVVCIAALDLWGLPLRRRLAAAGIVVVVFALLITPWGIHCKAERGAFFYNQNYLNVVYSLLPEGSDADHIYGAHLDELHNFGDVFREFSGPLISRVPGRAAKQFVATMGEVWRWPAGAFVVLGIILLFVRRSSRAQVGYYVFALLFFSVLLLVFYNDRFGLFLLPFYAAVAARGLLLLPPLAGDRVAARAAVGVVLAGLVAYGAWTSVGYNRRVVAIGDARIRDMAEWFVENVPPHMRGHRVVARKPAFAYFAGLDNVPFPVVRSHEELLRYLHDEHADYLLYSTMARRTRPEVAYLYEYKRKHPGLTLVLASRSGILYRVEPADSL